MEAWRSRIVWSSPEIRAIAASAKRVAVLGIRSEKYADRPAHYVAAYLAGSGVVIIPVPVQEKGVATILGQKCRATLAEIFPAVDIVDVFRRGPDVQQHLPDLLAARPACVWMQSGIRNEEVAIELAKAGIRVVQDHCLMVEHRAARAAGLVA
jgi:predicted CoA-binding protein